LIGLTASRENPKQNSHHNTLHRRFFLLCPDIHYNGKNSAKL